MATTSQDSIWSLGSTRVVVPVGATLAVFMQPFPGQMVTQLKLMVGGTCEILPAGSTQVNIGFFIGTTQPAATLAALSGSGYMFSAGEVLSLSGPAMFYLSSTGATSVLHALFGKGQNT